jgi:nucleotide-binding universal stress UspA family protein
MKILIAADVSQCHIESNSGSHSGSASALESQNDSDTRTIDINAWIDLKQLAGLVELKGSDITLLYVKEELPSYERVLATQADFPQDLGNVIEREARPVLEDLADQLRSHGATVKVEIVTGPPAYMIEQTAIDEKKELLVVTSGKRAGDLFLLGSTSANVARHAPCSTLVLRERTENTNFDNVLVAVDGSEQSLKAVEAAMKKLAVDLHDKNVHLIHVASVSPVVASLTPRGFVVAMEENLLMEGEIHLAKAQNLLKQHGFKNIDINLTSGNPAAEIIKAVETTKSKLVVLGAQGKGAIKHFLLGEVANRVITHSPVAVLVARN